MIRKNTLESGVCTASYCRTFLEPGQGNQIQHQDGKLDRFCVKHFYEWIHNLENIEKILLEESVL